MTTKMLANFQICNSVTLSKCEQICSFLQIWPHLLKKSSMKNFIFCAVRGVQNEQTTVSFEEPGNFLKNQLSSLLLPRNTDFYKRIL